MGIRELAMVTVQVRDFEAMVTWYRDVLGLGVGWFEPGEFCTLSMPAGGAALALAAGHRASDYADHLLMVTAALRPHFWSGCVGAIAGR